jgi:hypothetical protein
MKKVKLQNDQSRAYRGDKVSLRETGDNAPNEDEVEVIEPVGKTVEDVSKDGTGTCHMKRAFIAASIILDHRYEGETRGNCRDTDDHPRECRVSTKVLGIQSGGGDNAEKGHLNGHVNVRQSLCGSRETHLEEQIASNNDGSRPELGKAQVVCVLDRLRRLRMYGHPPSYHLLNGHDIRWPVRKDETSKETRKVGNCAASVASSTLLPSRVREEL